MLFDIRERNFHVIPFFAISLASGVSFLIILHMDLKDALRTCASVWLIVEELFGRRFLGEAFDQAKVQICCRFSVVRSSKKTHGLVVIIERYLN